MSNVPINDEERAKSLHLDTCCFDSGSENWLSWDLLREQRVKCKPLHRGVRGRISDNPTKFCR